MNKPVIAIDGPAASGKGTLARNLAERLGYAYLDTGSLYRGVAYEVLQGGGDCEDVAAAVAACGLLHETLKSEGQSVLQHEGLREERVASGASKVASIQEVRAALVDVQRSFARMPGDAFGGSVLDGRDIGTVICPDADVKLFITAETPERAKRRTKELHSKGIDVTYGAVLADMRDRDDRDSGRKVAPLKPADDAYVIDTTSLSEVEVFENALQIIKSKTS